MSNATKYRLLITHPDTMIGQACMRKVEGYDFTPIIPTTDTLPDWLNLEESLSFFMQHEPDYVIVTDGMSAGIMENKQHPYDFISYHMQLALNIVQAAHAVETGHVLYFGSSCMYPKETKQPMSEDALLSGKPEPTSIGTAMGKLSVLHLGLCYNQQYDVQRFIPLIPNNIYGSYDDFNPKTAHVLSALVAKFHKAKLDGDKQITLWGSGAPMREFLHVDDLADACFYLLKQSFPLQVNLPINIGSGKEYSIKELAQMIADVVGYQGDILWDTDKPNGTMRKLLDSSRIHSLGWQPTISLEEGIERTYGWYKKFIL